jgi:hypothetical protein
MGISWGPELSLGQQRIARRMRVLPKFSNRGNMKTHLLMAHERNPKNVVAAQRRCTIRCPALSFVICLNSNGERPIR